MNSRQVHEEKQPTHASGLKHAIHNATSKISPFPFSPAILELCRIPSKFYSIVMHFEARVVRRPKKKEKGSNILLFPTQLGIGLTEIKEQ